MDIKDLEVFLITAKEGQLSKTAEKLQFVQSSITNKIKKLESHFGTPLFYRHANGVTLTSAGRDLLPYAEKILHTFEEAEKSVGNYHIPSGNLKIGSMETTAAIRLPSLLSSYCGNYPEVELIIETGPTETLINKVIHYELEGAFVADSDNFVNLNKELFVSEELFIIGSRPITAENIENSNIIVFKKGCSYRRKFEEYMAYKGFSFRRIMEFGSLESIIGCVQAGLGYTVLPLSVITKMNIKESLRTEKLDRRFGDIRTVFVSRKDLIKTKAFNEFVAQLKNQ